MNNTTYVDSTVFTHLDAALWLRITFVIYLLVIHVVGVPGNIIVAVIYGRTSPKSACDWLILTMSITDAVVCFFTPPFYLRAELRFYIPWKFNILCSLEHWLQFTAMIASCMILVVIAMDRYVKICHPSLVSLTPTRARNVGVLCVITSAGLCVFPFVQRTEITRCYMTGIQPPESVKTYSLIMFCGFVISFITVIFAYANICKHISDKNKLKQRLKKDNGLRSHTTTVKDRFNRHGSCWEQTLIKWRENSCKMSNVPKDKCGTEYKSCQYIKLADDSLDNTQEKNGFLKTHDSISIWDSRTTLFHTEVIVNIDNVDFKETRASYLTDAESEIGNTEEGETTGSEKFNTGPSHDKTGYWGTSQLLVSKAINQREEIISRDVELTRNRFLNLGNEEISHSHAELHPTSLSQRNEEIISNTSNIIQNKTKWSQTACRKGAIDLCSQDDTFQTKRAFDTTRKDVDDPAPRRINFSGLYQRLVNKLGISHDHISQSCADIPYSGILFFRQKCGENRIKQSLVSQNCMALCLHEIGFKGSNTVCASCKENYSFSQPVRTGTSLFHIKSSQMKKAFSCPNVIIGGCDRSMRIKNCSKNVRMCASHSDLSDRLINIICLQNKYKLDCAFRHSEHSNYDKNNTICSIKRPLSLLLPSSSVLLVTNSKFAVKENKDDINLVCNERYKNVAKNGQRLRGNLQDSLVYASVYDGDFLLNKKELPKCTRDIRRASSISHSPCTTSPGVEFEELTFNTSSSESVFEVQINEHCSHLEICDNSPSCSSKIDSSGDNIYPDTVVRRNNSNTTRNHAQDLNKPQLKLKESSHSQKDFLTLPCIPPQTVVGHNRSIEPKVSGTISKVASPHVKPQNSTRCSLEVSDVEFGDLPTDVSSTPCLRQNIERECKNSKISTCRLKTSKNRKTFRRERQMTLMLVSVTAAFLLSWLPPWIMYMLWYYGAVENSTSFAVPYIGKIYLVNNIASPFIYYNFNPSFRSKVKELMVPVFKCFYCWKKK